MKANLSPPWLSLATLAAIGLGVVACDTHDAPGEDQQDAAENASN